jgi:MFS family permease
MELSPTPTRAIPDAGRRWLLLGLLVASVCINYVDRGNLSVAAREIGEELSLTMTDKGLLFSAFFWSYALCLPFSGWLIDRFRVTHIYTCGYFIWSLATTLTGAVTGMPILFFLRLVLGAGESVAYPAYSKIISARFREDERGIANAWIDAGSKSGPALGVLAGGLMLGSMGWRGMFYCIGIASMVWLVPWYFATRKLDPPEASKPAYTTKDLPSFRKILSLRSAWGTFIGLFCANYAWYFLLTWLPPYLVTVRHYTPRMLAIYGSLPFWGVAASSLAGGWISDRWIRSGGNPSLVRKTFVSTGLLLCTLLLPACVVKNDNWSLVLTLGACLSFGLFSSNVWAITQTLAGERAAGKWTGAQNAFANLAGIVAPWATGSIVDRTGSFFLAFVAVAGISVLGALSYLFLLGPVKETSWDTPPHAKLLL